MFANFCNGIRFHLHAISCWSNGFVVVVKVHKIISRAASVLNGADGQAQCSQFSFEILFSIEMGKTFNGQFKITLNEMTTTQYLANWLVHRTCCAHVNHQINFRMLLQKGHRTNRRIDLANANYTNCRHAQLQQSSCIQLLLKSNQNTNF